MMLLKQADLALGSFILFVIVCYLVLLWSVDVRQCLSNLFRKFGFNPIRKTVPELDKQKGNNYQNTNKYTKKRSVSPRMFIQPILHYSPKYEGDYRANYYSQSSILLLFTHAFASLRKLCTRVYRLLKRLPTRNEENRQVATANYVRPQRKV